MRGSAARDRNQGRKLAAKAVAQKVAGGVKQCQAGHIADQWGYCQLLDCKYSRDYKNRKRSIRK